MMLDFRCSNCVGVSFAEQHRKICLLSWVIFIISGGCIKFLGDLRFVQRFYDVTLASDLAATTGSIGARRSHKNLHAPNLHTSYFNGICHGKFGAACSIWEIRAEIRLGQNLCRLRWGAHSARRQLHFVLLAAFKAINTSKFTQSFE